MEYFLIKYVHSLIYLFQFIYLIFTLLKWNPSMYMVKDLGELKKETLIDLSDSIHSKHEKKTTYGGWQPPNLKEEKLSLFQSPHSFSLPTFKLIHDLTINLGTGLCLLCPCSKIWVSNQNPVEGSLHNNSTGATENCG